MKNIQVIDVIRSFAVWAVLASHSSYGIPSKSYSFAFLWYKTQLNGSYGVYLFFVVSGFLITRLIASGPKGLYQPDLQKFYIRRIGRILPLLILFCLIGLTFNFFITPSAPPKDFFKTEGVYFWVSIGTFWFNWYGGLPSYHYGVYWAILWTLSVEEQFYFIYPLVLKRLGNKRNLMILLAILIALGPLSQWVGYSFFRRSYMIDRNSLTGFGLIAMGCMLYLITEHYKDYFAGHKKICIYLCLIGFLIMVKIYFHQPYFADYWGNIFNPSLIGFGLALFLLGSFYLRFFESPHWRLIALNGKMSYGIYLYQYLIFFILYPFLHQLNQFFAFGTAAVFVFLLSFFSYHFYEKPANYFIRKRFGENQSLSHS